MDAKRNSEFLSVKDLMQEVLKKNKLQKGIDIVEVKEAWKSVMGAGVSSYTESLKFKNSTLIVKLSSSVLREELSYGKEKMIALLNEQLKKVLIKNIKLL